MMKDMGSRKFPDELVPRPVPLTLPGLNQTTDKQVLEWIYSGAQNNLIEG
jgi:hypothetical protein